jgi:NADH:ubiquinone oxidoreductase subunit 5 (subunit L)/multisubunit Na+/H+ antiporter MnhA subunit
MEGPTPVSALIHAATMVTAGVFLIIRLSPIFEYAPLALNIITLIGALTALFGATVGLVQNDVKRVVAYSTSSQLGYMIFACGLSNYSASFYHLINHAFFKAALFLASGALIHGINDSQDIREMGGLASKMPYTFLTMVLGSFALAGLPFLSGAYSKDLILEIAYLQATTLGRLSFIFGIVAAFFTAAYSVRLIFLVFLRPPKANLVTNKLIFKTKIFYNKINFIHDVDNIIIIPLAILALGSVFSGTFLKEVFNYAHLNLFKQAIFILDNNLQPMVYSCIPNILKWVPAGTTILSILAITGLYLYKPLAINLFFKTYLGSRLYTFLINA